MKSEIKPSRRKKGSQGGMCFADVVAIMPLHKHLGCVTTYSAPLALILRLDRILKQENTI